MAHGGEVGDQFWELRLVADRVPTDDRKPHPRPVCQRSGPAGVEVVALARLHRERRQRIRVVASINLHARGRSSGSRTRRRRPHQHHPGAGDQQVTEQIERQHVRAQTRQQN